MLVHDENKRLARLRELRLLDTAAEPGYDAFTTLAARICGTPVSLVSLIDESRQWFKSNHGLDGVSETPREVAFCARAIAADELMEVPDATKDHRFKDNPLVTSDPNIRFYAGAPLIVSGGFAIGTLCVIDRETRTLTTEQREQLLLLARALVALIESRIHLQLKDEYESAIRAEKNKVQRTLDVMPEAVITTDPDGKIEYMNTAAERFLHLRVGFVAGHSLISILNATDPRTKEPLNILSHLDGLRTGLVALRPDGSLHRIAEFSATPLRGWREERAGYVVVLRDVSETI